MKELIAFIGGGQMAGSLIGGLLAAGHAASRIRVAEPNGERAAWLRKTFAVEVKSAAAEIVDGAQAVVLAVKPQAMHEAVRGLRLAPGTTVISIAAGIRIESLRQWLGGAAQVVRCMPNTPALLRCGVTGLYAPPAVPAASRALAEAVLKSVGAVCWVKDEAQLDAVTALSGSGPAYFFLVVEALREAGMALGLDAETAKLLAAKTFAGAARMAEETGQDVKELRANVTSKGGTTEAAVAHLEDAGLRKIFKDALDAANRRARELGDSLART